MKWDDLNLAQEVLPQEKAQTCVFNKLNLSTLSIYLNLSSKLLPGNINDAGK